MSELFASITVFLVSLPISLGIAIASGVAPVYGIITSVIGALVVSPLSGSPLQIYGPSAGVAVMILNVVQVYGATTLIPLAIITGVFQIMIALLKWGHLFQATPPSLVKAMLSGIGFLIILSQLYILFGFELSDQSFVNIVSFPSKMILLFKEGLKMEIIQNVAIALIVFLTVALYPKGKKTILSKIPAPLVGVVASILVSELASMDVRHISLPHDINSFFGGADFIDSWERIDFSFIAYSLGFSFVASVETMLCVSAIDRITDTDSKFNKTILAQGIGNLVAGSMGTIPVVGVISRSAANIEAGAKTRLSAVLQGLWIVLLLFIPSVLEYIPLAALLGLLLHVGYKLLDPLRVFGYVRNYNKTSLIFFTTFVLIVTLDLLVGILAGFVVAILILLFDVLKYDLVVEERHGNKVIKFTGKLSFLDLPVLSKELSQYTGGTPSNIEVCLREVRYIDPAIKEKLENLKKKLEKAGHNVEIKNQVSE